MLYTPPLIPNDILKRFVVAEPYDTRFAANARLLQSIWREARGFEIGTHLGQDGSVRPLGSRLSTAVARSGRNFITPDHARLARRESIYREVGALIDEERLWENLLSSQPLTFNLFGLAKLDRVFGTRLLRALLPDFVDELLDVRFEHSPGRGQPAFTGDGTAFDVGFHVRTPSGRSGLIGVEIKYSESMRQLARPINERLGELALASGLYKDPMSVALRTDQCAQLLAEHMLAYSTIEHALYEEALFLFIAPTGNREAWMAVENYRAQFPRSAGAVPFRTLSLEETIAATGSAGEPDIERLLRERYVDFAPVDALLDDWEPYEA